MKINDKQFTEAVALIHEHAGTLRTVAEMAEVSEMYVRKLIKQDPAFQKIRTVEIFGRALFGLASVQVAVDERNRVLTERIDARQLKAEARETKLQETSQEPTLLDLRIIARDLSIPISNKTKAILAAEIATRQEAIASGAEVAPSDDPYLLKTADELRVLCRNRGLKNAGTKPFIIARLKENDAEIAAKALEVLGDEQQAALTFDEGLGIDAAVEALDDYNRESEAKSAANLSGLVAE